MKTKYALIILLGSMMSVGCSSVQDEETNIEDASISETSEAVTAEASTDEVPASPETTPEATLDAPTEEVAELAAPAAPAEEPVITDLALVDPNAQPAAPTEQPVAEQPAELAITETAPVMDTPVITEPVVSEPVADTQTSSDPQAYTVKQGDTLMKIAFENYGDLYRWREIYESNRSKIQDPNAVPPGTQLSLNGAGMVTIERNGEQYLIKGGDTLGSISHDVYGTKRKWKELWENNRQMIRDPNKIYAGFYLYYKPAGRMTEMGLPESKESAAI